MCLNEQREIVRPNKRYPPTAIIVPHDPIIIPIFLIFAVKHERGPRNTFHRLGDVSSHEKYLPDEIPLEKLARWKSSLISSELKRVSRWIMKF